MPRRPRLELSGVPLHVIQRVAASASQHGCVVHAYVLMPNHVHLLVTPAAAGAVGAMMQDIGRRYVRVFSDRHGRTGTLWEGRYKAAMVDTERYFLVCQRYVELNPVRAGLAADPADYRWSSHRHYGLGASNPLLTPHEVMQRLAHDAVARRDAYLALFREALDRSVVDRIRSFTNRGWAIGSEDFVRRVQAALGRVAAPPKRGRPAKRPQECAARAEMLI
jgi:putative transposase